MLNHRIHRKISSEKIVSTVAIFFQVHEADIIGTNNTEQVEHARFVAAWFLREFATSSFHATGQCLGNRSADEAQYALKKARELDKADPKINQKVLGIRAELGIMPENYSPPPRKKSA